MPIYRQLYNNQEVTCHLNSFNTCLKLIHCGICCGALNTAHCKLLNHSQMAWSNMWPEVFISVCGVKIK